MATPDTHTLDGAALFAPGEPGAGTLGGVPFNARLILDSLRHKGARPVVEQAFAQFTREQLNAVHHVVNTRTHVVVRSTAGSGKSRLLKVMAEVLPARQRIVAVALNVSIAKELKASLPADVIASTFHALGSARVTDSCPVDPKFVQWKRKHIIERLLKERGVYRKQEAKALLQLTRATMTYIANTPEQITALVSDLDLVFPPDWDVVALVKAVQAAALDEFLTAGHYDYEDMLYLPLKMGYGYGSVDVALVDEAQDFSRLQHRLLKHLLGKTGRMVLVGDENQGVNGFAGADMSGMSRAAELPGTADLRLTVTFRCPEVAVDLAAEFTDDIKAAPGAKRGELIRGTEDDLLTWLRPGDLVMARRNAPVVGLALKLAGQGTPVEVLGHDFVTPFGRHMRRALAYLFMPFEIERRLRGYSSARLQEHDEACRAKHGTDTWRTRTTWSASRQSRARRQCRLICSKARVRRCGGAPSTRPRASTPSG